MTNIANVNSMMVLLVLHQVSPAGNKLRVLGDPHESQQAKQAQHPSLWPPVSHIYTVIIVIIVVKVKTCAQSCTIQILTVECGLAV